MVNHNKRYMAKVVHGTIDHTPGGLKKKDIKKIKTTSGQTHYVSKKRSKNATKNFKDWHKAVKKAKKNLGIPVDEFVLLKKSSALYKEAARIYYD